MNRDQAHALVDRLFDMHEEAAKGALAPGNTPAKQTDEGEPVRKLPEGKRVVRTKTSGDRVYLLDDNTKTRQWITAPEIVDALGFTMADVVEVDDNEMLKYQMGSPLHKAPDNAAPAA